MIYTVFISEDEYKPFQQIENLTRQEVEERFNHLRNGYNTTIKISDSPYILRVFQCVPFESYNYTYAGGELENTETGKNIQCIEVDDSILGEYYFYDSSTEQDIYIDVLVKKNENIDKINKSMI